MMAFKSIAVLVCVVVCKSEHYRFEGGHINTPADEWTDSSLDQNFQESKLKSFILQLYQHDTVIGNSKERHIRATNEDFADILANNPELQDSIKAIFGSPDNPTKQQHQINNTQSVDPSLQYDSELRAIIDKTFEPPLETREQNNDRNSDPTGSNYQMKSEPRKRNTSVSFNEMIFKLYGPEVKTPMFTDREATDENDNVQNIPTTSNNNGGDGVSSTSSFAQSGNGTQTSDGSKKSASNVTKSSVIMYILVCLMLFFIF